MLNIENLINAYVYPHTFTTYLLYIKKEKLEVIKIHMNDFADSRSSSKEIKEALQAINNDAHNFILIPRINIKNRLDVAKAFITKIRNTKTYSTKISKI